METLLESIRLAVSADASDETKAAGATACRTILTALEAKPGEPMQMPSPTPALPIDAIAAAVRGMPVEQLLDVAIARLRAALPAEAAPVRVKPLSIPLVAVPRKA